MAVADCKRAWRRLCYRPLPCCSVAGCLVEAKARGYCLNHYARAMKYGDPLAGAPLKRTRKSCAHCGVEMVLRPSIAAKTTYCSRRCAGDARTAATVPLGACRCCGAEVRMYASHRSKAGVQEFCSRACARALPSRIVAERDALRRIAAAWRWKPSPAVQAEVDALRRIARYVERPRITRLPCKCCGTPAIGTMQYPRLCAGCRRDAIRASRKARKKTPKGRARRHMEKAARRMRLKAAAECIDPIKVFERDKWRCHLCRRLTVKTKRGTSHEKAPELDHIVSLADGGTHTWGNVACACRKCNGDKGARSMGQLGLGIAA